MDDLSAKSASPQRNDTGDTGLHILASGVFKIEGDAYKLITFLNQTLKDMGFIFGMSKHRDGLTVTVYRAEGGTEAAEEVGDDSNVGT